MTSDMEIGVPGDRSNLPQTGAMPVSDRPADYPAGAAAFRGRFEYFSTRGMLPCVLFISFLCVVVLAITGCSSAPRPQLGAISVANPSGTPPGQVRSVIVNASVNVSVAVSNDGANLGVDWTLLCGGSPNAIETTNVCGTITPVHVGSNINMVYLAPEYVPVGNTVTLTATVTSDPSLASSATLTILPQPVTLEFTEGALPPPSMPVSGTTQLGATVSNDPDAEGVKWTVTCRTSSCGSITSTSTTQSTYTAPAEVPAGGTVKVTATSIYDPTKSINATIAILPVTVTITPNPVTVPARDSTTLTATVTNDVFNRGVKWENPVCDATVTKGNPDPCGTITGEGPGEAPASYTATYTAPTQVPKGGSVKVTVVAVTDPTATATVDITIGPLPPISVTVTATSSSIQANYQTIVAANVDNDLTNAGVNWSCNPGYCSSTQSTGQPPYSNTYHAPASVSPSPEKATVTATSIANNKKSGSAAIEVYAPISVTINAPMQAITAGKAATFSATVTNEIGSGGVDWTATCPFTNPPCGTFSSNNHSASGANITYTPPQEAPWPAKNPTVTITATSHASLTVPPAVSESATVPVTPVPYPFFVPYAPSALPLGNSTASLPALVSLIAVAADDPSNAGVDWTLSCADRSAAACGQFLETPELAAPTIDPMGGVPVPAKFWPYGKTIHVPSGQPLSYQPPTQMPTGGTITFTVTSTANPSASASHNVTIINSTTGFSGVALSGTVRTGNLPVSGASVELFEAGNQCYGSAYGAGTCPSSNDPLVLPGQTQTTSVATASDGSFAVPAGYTCGSANSLLYLVATGGTPQGVASANQQLGLMTALGPCGSLNSSVSLMVNEVTTVASVFALAPFTGADYTQIGSSSANYNNGPNPGNATNYNNGLANAFATVNNLVNITTGQALAVTPAGNGTAPQAEINTLADVIDTCAATAGGAPGDSTPCGAYFVASNSDPPNNEDSSPSNAPTTILQAVLEEAKVPSTIKVIAATSGNTAESSGGPLFDLLPSPPAVPPFIPVLASAPYDWSISIGFTGGGLEGTGAARTDASAMALDASGNVWVSNKNISSVTKLSNLGAALSPWSTTEVTALGTREIGGGFTGGGILAPKDIAVDPYGNVWILNNGSTLSELNSAGTPLTSATHTFSGAGNPANTGIGLAIDGIGNAWVADSGSPGDVAEYAGYNGGILNGTQTQVRNGKPLSPVGAGYAINPINLSGLTLNPLGPDPNGVIAVDGSGDVWILDGANFVATKLGSTGAVLDSDAGDRSTVGANYILSSTAFGVSMAIDNAGDLFIPSTNSTSNAVIYELLAGGSSANEGGTGQTINTSIYDVYPPVAIDGSGHQWLVVQTDNNNQPPLPMALAGVSSSGASQNSNYLAWGLVPASGASFASSGPISLAVDASGDVWILSGNDPSTVTEFVGVASPVPTPFSVAVQEKKLGKTP